MALRDFLQDLVKETMITDVDIVEDNSSLYLSNIHAERPDDDRFDSRRSAFIMSSYPPPPCPYPFTYQDDAGGRTPNKHLANIHRKCTGNPSHSAQSFLEDDMNLLHLENFEKRQQQFRQTLSPQILLVGRKSLPPPTSSA
jgi:hypothetical protein